MDKRRPLLLLGIVMLSLCFFIVTETEIMRTYSGVYRLHSFIENLAIFGRGDLLYLEDSRLVLGKRDESRDPMFFITTDHKPSVRARYLCSAESAARLHPERDVYLLIADPPKTLNKTINSAMLSLLKQYPNFQVLSLDMQKTFKNTIFDHLYTEDFKKGPFIVNDVSDILRVLTVFRYGGTYLDSDIILLHRLDNSYNFVSAETNYELTNSVLNFVEKLHPVAHDFLMEMNNTFRTDMWGYLGPGSVKRVMERHCNISIIDLINNVCATVTVLPPYKFFGLKMLYHWYFNESMIEITRKRLEKSVGIHLWNKVTSNTNITVNSKQPLALIAKEVCPYSYWSCESGYF